MPQRLWAILHQRLHTSTKMSKNILWGILFVVIALTTTVWWKTKQTNQTKTQNSTLATQPPKKHATQQHGILQKCQKMTPLTQTKQKEEEHTLKEGSSYQEALLFEPLTLEEAKLTTLPRANVEPLMAVTITNHALTSLNKGDTLTLTDIEGYDYPLTIRSVTTYDDGTISTTGVYSDEGIDYTTTITQAKGTSYITLSTPRGIYEIETKNDVGYVYSANEIRKRLQRGHKDDTIPYQPQPKKGE